jgi:hypothetical protein
MLYLIGCCIQLFVRSWLLVYCSCYRKNELVVKGFGLETSIGVGFVTAVDSANQIL